MLHRSEPSHLSCEMGLLMRTPLRGHCTGRTGSCVERPSETGGRYRDGCSLHVRASSSPSAHNPDPAWGCLWDWGLVRSLQACPPELRVAASLRPSCVSGSIQTFSYLENMGPCVHQSTGGLAFLFVSLETPVDNLCSLALSQPAEGLAVPFPAFLS